MSNEHNMQLFLCVQHESSLDKPGNDRDKKRESLSSLNIPLPLNQQADAAQNPKATGVLATTSNVEMGTNRPGMTGSRKSSARVEVGFSLFSSRCFMYSIQI